MKTPYLFDEFFASGLEESISPFLTKTSRKWGKNISLKSALAAATLLLLAFVASFASLPLSYLLLSFVYFLVGVPALLNTLHDLKNIEINIDILMTLAAFVACLLGSSLEGALLLVLFNISHAMEEFVSKNAHSAIHNLDHIAPKTASLIDSEGVIFQKSVRDIQIGEIVIVKNGEIIPLDGKITKGTSSLNLVHLTGESIPIPKTIGDIVPAGAKNLESALFIEVSRISADSTLSKIMQLITAAAEAKPKLQSLLDRFGQHYATAIIFLTLLFAITLPFLFSISFFGYEGSIYRSLAFLIAASPCALIIATPTAYLSAISACAKKGILLKGGVTLDALSVCTMIAFDKTGTLTTGELICSAIEPFRPTSLSIHEAISIAYSLEQHIVHPIATAITKLAQEKKLLPQEISDLKTIPGSGIEAWINKTFVAIGNPDYIGNKLSQNKQLFSDWIEKKKQTHQILCTLLIGEDVFLFQFSDCVREEMVEMIQQIKQANKLQPVMLTGDHVTNAQAVGRSVGITDIFANLRPEDKLEKVAKLSQLEKLAMVGDGINDAPSLARATVGISMGKIGSAAAIDASDVVLLNDDIHLLSWLFTKSHQTKKIVKQNLTLALSVICLATIPSLFGLIPLWLAVILHEGGTLLVGINSLRLLKR
jgi:Cd2+/Zn2+-exporting ATPase